MSDTETDKKKAWKEADIALYDKFGPQMYDVDGLGYACFSAGYDAARKWISIKDKMPKEHVFVLLTDASDKYGRIRVGALYLSFVRGWYWVCGDGVELDNHVVTHWMPMPQSPNEN